MQDLLSWLFQAGVWLLILVFACLTAIGGIRFLQWLFGTKEVERVSNLPTFAALQMDDVIKRFDQAQDELLFQTLRRADHIVHESRQRRK